MRCRARSVLAVSLLVIASGVLLVQQWEAADEQSRVPEPFRAAFSQYASSEYLQERWGETCDFPLKPEHILLMAEIDASTITEPKLRCFWNEPPAGVLHNVGVTFASEQTDIHEDWIGCETLKAAFAHEIYEAVHRTGSPHVHLGSAPPTGSGILYVLASKCHYWDRKSCSMYPTFSLCEREDAGAIMSAAYAVLDTRDNRVYW